MGKALNSVGIARIATLVLGVIVMGVGLHSHFKSAWTGEWGKLPNGKTIHTYDLCTLDEFKEYIKLLDKPCPKISLERYYVAMIIICFIVSLIMLIASFVTDLSSSPLKLADLGYHVVAAILLLIAAIVYLISAEQINKISKASERSIGISEDVEARKELRGEKLVAGALTIIQALLYGVVALLIGKQSS